MSVTTPPPVDTALFDEAVALASAAGERTLRWFQTSELEVDTKADNTPVTAADRDAEQFIRDHLAQHHPGDAVVGEEHDDTEGSSGRCWIIDPIDGTKAFMRGVPLYSSLLAVDDEHGPAVGVIVLPALNQVVAAGRGLGCFANGTPCAVSDRATLSGSCVTTSGFSPWDTDAYERVRTSGAILRTWGDGYGYAMVATGRAEAMVDPAASRWDVAPMPVIITEAGGRFTTADGSGTGADGGSGLATNGVLHDQMLALLNSR